jgi:hypothetical protein
MEGKVVKLVDNDKLAINIGLQDGIKKNDIFIIFEKQEEIFDPDTQKSLGYLEVPKLKMKVFNMQDKITLLESSETKIITDKKIKRTIKKKSNLHNRLYAGFGSVFNDDDEETIIEEEPKEQIITTDERNIKIGDIARKIN